MSGNTEQGAEKGQGVAGVIENSLGKTEYRGGIKTYDVRISSEGTKNQRAHCYETDRSRALDTGGENPDSNHGGVAVVGCDLYNQTITGETASTITSACGGTNTSGCKVVTSDPQAVCYGISAYDSNAMKSPNPHSGVYEADTSRTLDNNGGSPACNQGGMAIVEGVDLYNQTTTGEISKTLNAVKSDSDHVPCVAYGLDRASFNQGKNAQFGFSVDEELSPPIVAKGPGGVLAKQ